MKYNNTFGGKRQTKKRGGTKSKNAKSKKAVKTEKQQQAAEEKQQRQDRNEAIINRIKEYNKANSGKLIAEKYGFRALNTKDNNKYTNQQITDLTDRTLYNLYNKHKLVTATKRSELRHKNSNKKRDEFDEFDDYKQKSTRKSIKNTSALKSPVSPVSSLRQPFTDPDGNPSDYPFSNKKINDKNEKGLLAERIFDSPTTYPQDLFNEFNYIPKTPPINYYDENYDDMFDTPNSPK
jgi:hypothetical protein